MLKRLVATGIVGAGILLGGHVASASPDRYEGDSIVDYLYAAGEDHSFKNRAQLAKEKGIENYRGTASQNITLLGLLRGEAPKVEVEKQETVEVEEKQEEVKVEETEATEQSTTEKTITVTATAYTADCAGCSGVTYTGQDLKANPNQKVIAVDPNVIPLGSRVYVEGYGEAIAGDIGGAIKGNKIDLFIPNHNEAVAYGVRTVQVTILK